MTAVSASSSNPAYEVTKRDEALVFGAKIDNSVRPTSKMEEALLLMNDANVINDEELFLLQEANRPRNLHIGLPYWKYERFSLEDMRDDECEVEFRFKKDDVYNLVQAFGLPEVYRCYNGLVVDSVEALCVCLKRFTYPCRYADLVPRFGRPVPQLCMITNMMVDDLFDRYSC